MGFLFAGLKLARVKIIVKRQKYSQFRPTFLQDITLGARRGRKVTLNKGENKTVRVKHH